MTFETITQAVASKGAFAIVATAESMFAIIVVPDGDYA